MDQILAEIERLQDRLALGAVHFGEAIDLALHVGLLARQLGGLGRESGLVDRARQIGIQQALLHVRQFGPPLSEGTMPAKLEKVVVGERRLQRLAKPSGDLRGRKVEPPKSLQESRVQITFPPTDRRVVFRRMIVSATVIDVLADAAIALLSPDAFPGNREAANLATQQPARIAETGTPGPSVSAVQNVLAGVEGSPVDHQSVTALIDVAIPAQLADVESVSQDARQSSAMEPRLAWSVNVPFGRQLVGQGPERILSARIQLEDTGKRLRPLRVRNDRFVLIPHVQVSKGGQPGRPALPYLLVHPLDHFAPQIVAVILRNGGHHVE